MAELSSLGSVVRQALTSLTGSQRLPLEAVDGAAEQVAAAILAANQALGIATDAKAASVPTPPTGTPGDYVLRADKTYAAQGMPSAGQIRDALEDLPDTEQLDAGAIQPAPGYALVQVALSGLTKGSTFQLKVEDSGRVVLASAASVSTDPNLPAQMVAGTHFVVPVWVEGSTDVQINVTTPPSSTQPVTAYVISIDGAARQVTIPASTAMPYALDVTPELYPEIWQWGAASWVAKVRIAAVSSAGQGLQSAAQSVTISQSASYFWADADWTFAEERDYTASGNLAGRPKVSLSASHPVPDGQSLYYYMGPLPYTSANAAAIQAAAQAISPGGAAMATGGNALGSAVYGILLYKQANTQIWKPASAQKNFTVQGVIAPGAPVALTPASISGTGKIGSPLTLVAPTWSGSPTSTAIQWLNNGAAIAGATGTSYTPVGTDDLDDISVRVTATNAGGPTASVSAPVTVTYAAPTVATAVTAKSFAQQSGAYRTVDISGVFTGSGLAISVAGPSVGGVPICAVNQDDMTLGVNVSSVLAATTITLTASNSGGSITSTFSLTITATGTAIVPTVIEPLGGSVTSGEVAYTNYLADDMILCLAVRYSGGGFTKPDLAAWTGQYDWNQEFYGTGSGLSVGLFWRCCNGNGTDGTLGNWADGLTGTLAYPTYITVRGCDWGDPTGAVSMALKAAGIDLDHPGLTLEGASSIVLDFAVIASAISGQAAGLRPDVTQLLQTSTGTRRTISKSTAAPAPATWSPAADVPHTVTTNSSGAQAVGAIEIKGAAAVSTTFPAPIDASKVTVTEVTDPAVASANGFANVSGRLKTVIASDLALTATTVSGTFDLVFELASGENPAPPATGKKFTSGTYTYYTLTSLAVGTYAYPRLWWRLGTGASAQYKLAWSGTPFEIQGLDASSTGVWPVMPAVGTGINEALYQESGKYFYTPPKWSTAGEGYDTATGLGIKGPAFAAAAYASFAGNTKTDAYVLACLRNALHDGWDPSLQCGYGAQHDTGFFAAAYFAKNTPRLWTGSAGLTSTERDKITSLVKAGAVANAAAMRYNKANEKTGENWKGMNGNDNPSTLASNPNVRCAPRFNLLICAAFMGGVSACKSYLDSISVAAGTGKVTIASIYDDLVAKGLSNAANSFSPTRKSGAPSYADIQARCNSWSSNGRTLLQPNEIFADEVNWTFDQVCATSGGGKYTGTGRVLRTASTALNNLVVAKAVGMCHELNTTDTAVALNAQGITLGDRSSCEYGMWGIRLPFIGAVVCFTSGIVSRTNAGVIAAMARFKVGFAHFKEVTRDSVGWDDYAQGGGANSGDWYWSYRTKPGSGTSYRWGILPFFGMAEVAIAIADNAAISHTPASYFDDYGISYS